MNQQNSLFDAIDNPTENNITQSRINELVELINKYDIAYYNQAESLISDREYDRLFEELKDLEKKNPKLMRADSPTQRVGGTPLKQFKQVQHKKPMLSLANTYTMEEIEDFDRKIRDTVLSEFTYTC